MLPLARNGHTESEVRAALLAASRHWTFRYELLDANNHKIRDLTEVAAGSVFYNFLADVKGTARFLLEDDAGPIDYLSHRIKPYARLILKFPPFETEFGDVWSDNWLDYPEDSWVEWPCGVYLLSTPTRTVTASGRVVREVEGYDQGLVLRDDKLIDRLTIAAGAVYTDEVAGLLADIPDVSIIPSTATLPTAREWPPGTMVAEVVADLLAAISYEPVHFDADGRAIIKPYRAPADLTADELDARWTYANDHESVRLPEASQELDLFDAANEWVLVSSEPELPPLVSTVTNDSPDSPTSTVNRGRTITDFREVEGVASQAALDAQAQRLAFEASQVYEAIEFETGLMPFHEHREVYRIEFTDLDVSDVYAEHRYEFELRHGAVMKHRARRVVQL